MIIKEEGCHKSSHTTFHPFSSVCFISSCFYLKSEPFLFPRSGIPGSGHILCPWATPIWDTTQRRQQTKNIIFWKRRRKGRHCDEAQYIFGWVLCCYSNWKLNRVTGYKTVDDQVPERVKQTCPSRNVCLTDREGPISRRAKSIRHLLIGQVPGV